MPDGKLTLSAFTGSIKQMFDAIAPQYDLLNKINSFGLDALWRRKLADTVTREDPELILDLAAGTGDVTLALAERNPDSTVVAADLSRQMLYRTLYKAMERGLSDRVKIAEVDALDLPFEEGHFDAVTCAFGVRNFEDLPRGLAEMYRVLAPGGVVAILELCEPVTKPVNDLYQIHTRKVIPFVASLLGSDEDSYRYLHDSIAVVPNREEMEHLMIEAGFRHTRYTVFLPGVAALYVGYKARFSSEMCAIKDHFGKLLARATD